MDFEITIKIITCVLVFIFLLIRERFTSHYKITPRLMIKNVIIIILFVLYFLKIFDFAKINLNPYLRIFLGFPVIFLGIFLFFWSHMHLRENWSPVIEKKFTKSKKLVNTGPYKYLRHPIYSASLITLLGFAILTANWLFTGIPLLILIIFFTYKIPKEEKSLISNFGQNYRKYMKQTGGLFPKLIK